MNLWGILGECQDGDACSDQLEDHLEVRKLNPSKQKKDFFLPGIRYYAALVWCRVLPPIPMHAR